ncbi:hypothetical protein BH11PSE1_BH11PSE1_08020 [soil metagenome]
MKRLTALAALLTLSACAVPAIDAYQPTIANAQAARGADLPAIRVGDFILASGLPAGLDRSVVIRASTLRPPKGDSFSKYLGDCLAAELRAAGKLDPAANVVITGALTESKVSSGVSVGEASLGATFTVTRDGRRVFQKALWVSTVWESSFMGAIAIPDAMNQYTALYGKLVGALLSDEEFRAAIKSS